MKPPNLVVCDPNGNALDVPELLMIGAENGSYLCPGEESIVALPKSGILFSLPERVPIGYDPVSKRFIAIREYRGTPVFAAAAFMPPGYIQTLTSAYKSLPGAPRFPLYCYSAVGWRNGRFYVAGNRIDRQSRHEIPDDSLAIIDKKAKALRARHPANRLVAHLVSNCVLKYRCPNACNLALGRWECPVPVSTVCNAACIGCISKQPAPSCVPSTQHRIDFTPTAVEIAGYVIPHLKKAANPIASFGQGCEGEPLLQADLIECAIRMIRAETKRGIINLNTNASRPSAIERICRAGLQSMRVSLNSVIPEFYHAYYRPRGYSFDDVVKSIMTAKSHNIWVSINYLVFPGLTDHKSEFAALKKFLRKTKIDMIQTRNLNIDPEWYGESLGLSKLEGKPVGMVPWIQGIRKEFPEVKLGYFNPTCGMINRASTGR